MSVNNIDVQLDGKDSNQVATLLFDYVTKNKTETFVTVLGHICDRFKQAESKQESPKWDINTICNVWHDPKNNSTLLYEAACHNNIQIVQCLLNNGVKCLLISLP